MGKIDLTRFSKKQEAIIPIISGRGKYHGRLIETNKGDGWYQFTLAEDEVCERKATLLEIEREIRKAHTILTGYAYGDEVVPMNFENLFSKGLGETVKVWFLNQEPWTPVHFTRLEDGRFYYVDVAFAYHSRLDRLRKLFEAEKTLLGEKDISPELRYYWLLLSLERNTWKHLQELEALRLSEKEKKKRAEEFKLNFGERIRIIVEQAGGVFISATRQANNQYLVSWRVKGSRQQVRSVIRDNLRIENAGYCLSGHDAEHDLNSIIPLAKSYIEDGGSLYLTRV